MTVEQRVREVLPTATLHDSKHGWQIGGFSCPPVEARRMLSEAGFEVRDVWGATIINKEKT